MHQHQLVVPRVEQEQRRLAGREGDGRKRRVETDHASPLEVSGDGVDAVAAVFGDNEDGPAG